MPPDRREIPTYGAVAARDERPAAAVTVDEALWELRAANDAFRAVFNVMFAHADGALTAGAPMAAVAAIMQMEPKLIEDIRKRQWNGCLGRWPDAPTT